MMQSEICCSKCQVVVTRPIICDKCLIIEKIDKCKPVLVDPLSEEYREQFPFDVITSEKKVRFNKEGKPTNTRRTSEWNKFVKTAAKWNSLITMGSNKMTVLSLLYAEAKSGCDLKEFVKLEFISPSEMKLRFNL
jgi:hypothetical protein